MCPHKYTSLFHWKGEVYIAYVHVITYTCTCSYIHNVLVNTLMWNYTGGNGDYSSNMQTQLISMCGVKWDMCSVLAKEITKIIINTHKQL